MFLDAKAPHLSSTIPPILPWKINEPVQSNEGLTRQGSGIIGTFGQSEELRCVIAIVRQYVLAYDHLSSLNSSLFTQALSSVYLLLTVVIEPPSRK